MGSKGTTTQTQQSTYTPSAQTMAAGTQALSMAQGAASQPFQAPVAPVADFTGDQNQAFQQTRNLQGMAQPYYDQAQGLFNQSAAPITGGQVNNYLNPYAGYVMANMREQQGQQMNDLTGKATQAAGGVGADRIGVAQGELARQQGLAQGQTLSGIYGSALTAAQQDAQRQQSAAYGIGNLGGAAQNAALQGTNSLYGMGSQQQQLDQAKLNAPYQNQLAQIAYPYQNAQYLAGITGNLAGAMGGTTNGTTQTTPPAPSIWSQIAGLGTGLAGAYGAYQGLNSGSNSGTGNGSWYGQSSLNGAPLAARGGRMYAEGGETQEPSWMTADPTIPTIAMRPSQVNQPKLPQAQSGSGSSGGGIGDTIGSIAKTAMQLAPMLLRDGGAAYPHYADGGMTFDERSQPTMEALTDGTFDARGLNGLDPKSGPLGFSGMAPPMPRSDPRKMDLPPQITGGPNTRSAGLMSYADDDGALPPNAQPTSAKGSTPMPSAIEAVSPEAASVARANAADNGPPVKVPYGDLNHENDVSRKFARSPWTALMHAGFGMMAGTSPYAGVNIGSGLKQGVEALEKQREASKGEEEVNQRARQLALQADKTRREYTQMTPDQAARTTNASAALEQNKWQIAYDPDNGKPYWTKAGEKSIPAIEGHGPPGTPATPPAPTVAPATPATPKTPTDSLSYASPSPDARPAGPIYNGKTGSISSEHSAMTRKDMEDAKVKGEAANDALVKIGVLKQSLDQIDALSKEAGGALQTGAYAEKRFAIAKALNGVFAPLGIAPVNPELIGSAEEAQKITVGLGQAQARLLGAREAASVVQQSVEANPGISNTPEGRKYILGAMTAGLERQRDLSVFVAEYRDKWRTTAGAEKEFNKLNPPEKYVARAGILSAPPEFQKPEALQKAVKRLQENRDDPEVVAMFNKIYHGSAAYFLRQP